MDMCCSECGGGDGHVLQWVRGRGWTCAAVSAGEGMDMCCSECGGGDGHA